MLRERMAQRKERALKEIEVPAELLEGYDLEEPEAEVDQRDQNLAVKKTKKVLPPKPTAKGKKKRPRAYVEDEQEETY